VRVCGKPRVDGKERQNLSVEGKTKIGQRSRIGANTALKNAVLAPDCRNKTFFFPENCGQAALFACANLTNLQNPLPNHEPGP
jgi:hypothetical protein